MKKFKNLLLFLLVIPICFSFSACKNKKGKDNGGDGDDDNQPPVSPTQVYSVHFDYNLPEDYEYLLADRTISNKVVGSNTALLSVPNSKLRPWFLGWSYKGESDILTSSSFISSDVSTTLELVGNWDEENLKKYFYTSNLTFDINETSHEAMVSSCTESGATVIIPEVYVAGNIELESGNVKNETYKVVGINSDVFSGKTVGKIVLNAKSITIASGAFKNSNISSLNFENVKEIGDSAFENSNIHTVKFGAGLTKVGDGAFKNCESLQSVDFASASAEISANAFWGDGSLGEIKNAGGLTKIGDYAFCGCSSISCVDFLGQALTELGSGVFKGCAEVTSAVIPKSVLTIGTKLFAGCSKLQNLTISRLYTKANIPNGDKLTTNFGNISSSLTTITMQDDIIKTLTNNYFDGLNNLSTLIMCDSIENIEENAFFECSNLENITLSSGLDVEAFSVSVFYGTKFLTERTSPLIYKKALLYVPENISENYNFTDEKGEVVEVEKICDGAFSGNAKLKNITIPSTIRFIGDGAFDGCENLESVNFASDSNLTELSKDVFKNCKKLASINFENLTKLKTIDSGSLYCTMLDTIKIPSTVETIASNAFAHSQNLTKFEILGTSTKFSVIDGVLYEKLANDKLKLICYPASKAGGLFTCPDNVTKIASHAFVNAKNLDAIVFGASVSCTFETFGTDNNIHIFDQTKSGMVILSEDSEFYCNSRNVSTYYLVSNCEYNSSDDTISLGSEFSGIEGLSCYYIKHPDTVNNKVYYICFTVNESGDIKTATITKKIETNLQG